jgi:hypothetical protein
MAGRKRGDDYFHCPHCGRKVAAGASFCRHCGADPESGWNESTEDQAQGFYEDDFDYDDYLSREFPGASRSTLRPWLMLLVVLAVCLALLLGAFL